MVACDQADWIIGLKNKRQAELAKSCLGMEKSTPGLLRSPNFSPLLGDCFQAISVELAAPSL